MNNNLKIFFKDLVPPILWRTVRTFFYRPFKSVEGREMSADYYDKIYASSDNYSSNYTESHYYFIWSVITERLRQSKRDSILDLGCGPGQFASLLFDQGIKNYKGVDLSSTAIKMAQKNCPAFEFESLDIFESDILKHENYDCLIALEFLEHVEGDLKVIERVRSGTRFIATVPNFPDVAHVRYFQNANEVIARYEPLFRNFSVETLSLNKQANLLFFLMEGVKK